MFYIQKFYEYTLHFINNELSKISANTLAWITNIVLHCATLPSFLALMTGISDKTPPVDIVLMLWSALMLLFLRAVLLKDLLNIVTIGIGFMLQAVAVVLIFFN
jgi:hypothetical protein